MDVNSAQEFLNSRVALWIIGALATFLFLVTNLPWQLDDYDQAKQAFTSFEMVKEGHWLYQRTPHERIATKPPLVGWISAAAFELTRSWGLAWRLPSFAAAIAMSILLFRAGSVYGPVGGLVAAGAFAFNLLTPRLATLVRTDMPLALAIFLIGLLIWEKVRTREAWRSRDRSWIFVLLTAAMLIKGPIVYAFLLSGIAMFEFWERRRHVRQFAGRTNPSRGGSDGPVPGRACLQGWFGWWPWVASLGIFLLWVIGGSIFVPGFFDQVVVREFVSRFGETVHRSQPLFFYLPHLLQKFLPWSVLIMVLAFVDLRARRWKMRDAFREMSSETFWLLCWILGGLIVMSVVPSKRVDRIFPIIPPLCLLLAAQIGKSSTPSSPGSACHAGDRRGDRRRVSCPSKSSDVNMTGNEVIRTRVLRWGAAALLLSVLSAGGYSALKVFTGYRDHRDALVKFGRAVRDEAAAHHWRYEVLKTGDEGLLLYLEKTHFIGPEYAIAEWNRGNLDAVVAPFRAAPSLMRDFHGAALSHLKSSERKGESGNYVLITR